MAVCLKFKFTKGDYIPLNLINRISNRWGNKIEKRKGFAEQLFFSLKIVKMLDLILLMDF